MPYPRMCRGRVAHVPRRGHEPSTHGARIGPRTNRIRLHSGQSVSSGVHRSRTDEIPPMRLGYRLDARPLRQTVGFPPAHQLSSGRDVEKCWLVLLQSRSINTIQRGLRATRLPMKLVTCRCASIVWLASAVKVRASLFPLHFHLDCRSLRHEEWRLRVTLANTSLLW